MACTPLNVQAGTFDPQMWDNSPNATFVGKTLLLSSAGLSVTGAHSVFHSLLGGRTLHYMVLGGTHLLILDMESGAGSSMRRVSLVNFAPAAWTEVPLFDVLAASNAVPPPVVMASIGNGNVFLAFGTDGTELTSVAIYRSDNAQVLLSLGPPFAADGYTSGEATASELIIHYHAGGSPHTAMAPLPNGVYSLVSALPVFPDVFVGGCQFPPMTRQATIRNTGTDCLTITSIANVPPFTVQSTSPTLPVSLAMNETLLVTVAFQPVSPGDWNPANLPVSASDGSHSIACVGHAHPAVFNVQFSVTTVDFGTVPVGQNRSRTLQITNNGSRPLNVSVPGVSTSDFSGAAFSGTLGCGQSQTITFTFTPSSAGLHSTMVDVTSNAPTSPQHITLRGTGCVAHAEIAVPAAAPIDLGNVQQGFRTVRIFEVTNAGDGTLTFDAVLSGSDAALFGLPDPSGSVYDMQVTRSYSAAPVSPCGALPAGSGRVVLAVSFFANATPTPGATPKSATLTLQHHNATNVPAATTWVFPLSAVITAPIALDIALVADRSGSMNDALGSRVKLDAAISASQLFVELLRADLADRCALVRFNHAADVIVPMTPVSSTTAPTQTDLLTSAATGIPPATGATAIAGGTALGYREVQKPRATPVASTKAVVVVTDGQENTAFEDPPGSGAWFSIMGGPMAQPAGSAVTTAPLPRPAGVKTYAIGIGSDADIDAVQLNALAEVPARFHRVDQDLTGMQYFQLEKYYTQIFMDVVGMSGVSDPMYSITNGETQTIEFDVLRGDVDALVVILDHEGQRLPFHCVSPLGEIVDPVAVPPGFALRSGWTEQARFVEIAMPLGEPDRYAGRWKVLVSYQGRVCFGDPRTEQFQLGFNSARCKPTTTPVLYGIAIGVGSNLRMTPYVAPNTIYTGDPLPLAAAVSEAGLPVIGCDVTVGITAPSGAAWTLPLFDDGAHSDGAMDDGEYGNVFTHTDEPGTYHLLFRARGRNRGGEPVVREAMRDKAVFAAKVPGRGDGGPGQAGPCACPAPECAVIGFMLFLVLTAIAFLAVAYLIPGIHVIGFAGALLAALIFGMVNAALRPVVTLLGVPLQTAAVTLVVLLIDLLLALLLAALHVGFTVDGFLPAFWLALVMALVWWLLARLADRYMKMCCNGGRR